MASTQQADEGFTPEIPDNYVRDTESGEVFELAKLLPKLNVGSDSSDIVGFTIFSAGISLTPRKPQVLTNIEEWITAFNTYMIIIVQKFPNRASELTIHENYPSCGKSAWRLRLVYIRLQISPQSRRVSNTIVKFAIDNPTIVSNNLAKEVALGHTAGPFTNPPFANLQVSPIGIVPKKHSDKFRTIFHLSFPKTGESINSFIEKDDFFIAVYKNRRRHCRFNPIR